MVVLNSAALASPANPDAGFVQSLYGDVLGRAGTTNEVAAWVAEMNSGLTPQAVAQGFVNSIEHREDEVNILYEEFLHRAPDAIADNWVNALLSGVPDQSVAEAILNSPEFQEAHPDTTDFVQTLYHDVLGRTAGSDEVAGWETALASGETRQSVVASVVGSPEAIDQAVDSFYEDFLGRGRDLPTSNSWVNRLAAGDSTSDVAVGVLSSVEYLQDSAQA